jgi:hypothetical protein
MHLEVVGRLDATLELAPGKSVPPEKFVLASTPEDVAKQTMALVTSARSASSSARRRGARARRGSRFSAIACFPRSGRAVERPLRSIAR